MREMRPFVHEQRAHRVVFARGGAAASLPDEVDRLGARRVLLVAGGRGLASARRLAGSLGDRLVGTFTDVVPHVPRHVAEQARATATELRVDCLLCIGGGSAIGTAKAVALDTHTPIVAIPTTYSGSELTPIWGLTDSQHKQTGTSASVQPRVVIYDSELTRPLPPRVTGPSAMNAMAHSVEAFYGPGANPVTSLMAEAAIEALHRGAPLAVHDPDDDEGRDRTLFGAYLAGAAFGVAGSSLHHKICHILGGLYDLPHAELHTVILPQVAAFLTPALPEEFDRVARALGDAPSAAEGLFDLAVELGATATLNDIGLREADLGDAAARVLEQLPQDLPRQVDEASIARILEGAWTGRRPERATSEL